MLECRGRSRARPGHTNVVVQPKEGSVRRDRRDHQGFRPSGFMATGPWAAQERGLQAVGTKWAVSGQAGNVYVALEVSAWRGAVMGPRLGVLGAPGLRPENPGRVWAGMALSRGRLGEAVQLEAPGKTGFRGGSSSAPTWPSQPRAQPRDPGSRLRRPAMRLGTRNHNSRRAHRPLPGRVRDTRK